MTELRRLQILQEDAAVCDSCGLHESRTNSVFSRGSPQAHLMFVGEAPGRHEDEQGKPFVGQSGELLDRMIAAMGLADVYICNAIKCRPPDNRTPTSQELETCRPYLEQQILLTKPKVIVALGKSAGYALADGASENEVFAKGWAGRWREYKGTPLLITYHPAYLLRTPAAKKEVGRHLRSVLERLEKQ